MKEQIKIVGIEGFNPAITGMRLPTQTDNDSNINFEYDFNKETLELITKTTFKLGPNDAKLAKHLLNKKEKVHWSDNEDDEIFQGNVHGKFQRGIIVWLDITAPRKIWSELDTYVVGVSPTSSTSTMYTLRKEINNIDEINASMFDKFTEQVVIDNFKLTLQILVNKYGTEVKDIPIDVLKSALPEGWLQRRIKAFSYQSLRGLYLLRKTHRLHFWHMMCEELEQLPFFNELLIGK